MHKLSPPVLIFLITWMVMACQIATPRSVQPPDPSYFNATQSALLVETAIAQTSLTPTPTIAPANTSTQVPSATATITPTLAQSLTPTSIFQVTAQPDLQLVTHPDIPDFVFQIDSTLWEQDQNGTWNFNHKTVSGCAVKSVSGHGVPPPERLLWEDLGRFHWGIMDYGDWAYAATNQSSFLQLDHFDNPKCRADQEDILTNLMSAAESKGEIPWTPVQSPTPRAPLDGFDCPNTPPALLRVGDNVSVATDGLWLRSEPRVDVSTKLRQYLRYAPLYIKITGGPVCEKYVFWQVKINTLGEQSEEIEGWLAEGDLDEYFLKPVW